MLGKLLSAIQLNVGRRRRHKVQDSVSERPEVSISGDSVMEVLQFLSDFAATSKTTESDIFVKRRRKCKQESPAAGADASQRSCIPSDRLGRGPTRHIEDQDPKASVTKMHAQFASALNDALKLLNRPEKLASSKLFGLIPRLVSQANDQRPDDRKLSSLDQVKALCSVIQDAIEHLRPENIETHPNSRAAECYLALKRQYLDGKSAFDIARRLHMSERTFYHRRKAGIDIISAHLLSREEALQDEE